MDDKGYKEWVVNNVRAQFKVPDSVQDLPTIIEWMHRMRASKYMIKRFREAWKETHREGQGM